MTAWDIFQAELADTARGQYKSRPLLACVYCSTPTRALSQVCCAHTDLIELDYGYPAALEETDAPPRPVPQPAATPPASVSSSAVESEPRAVPVHGSVAPWTDGAGAASGLAALQ